MNFDIISSLKELLEESSESYEKAMERADDFVISSRQRGIHAKDQINSVKTEDSDDDNSNDIFKKAKSDIKDDNGPDLDQDDEKIETPDESPSTINLADAADFKNLIKILNQFRASQSLTDKVVYKELYKYFNNLTSEEKQVLHIFIKGLVQITLLDVDGEAAYTPSILKFGISKNGSASSEKIKSIKKKQASKENARQMNNSPIKIGDSIQEKNEILKIVKENRV